MELRQFSGKITEFGIYLNVPRDYYFDELKALSRSAVINVALNPKNLVRTFKRSKSMDLGDIVHTYFNEREIFNSMFYVKPDAPIINGKKLSLATKAGKQWKTEVLKPFLIANASKQEISKKDINICKALEAELSTCPEFNGYHQALKEVTLYNELEFGGQKYPFKCRLDGLDFDELAFYDFKTTASVETHKIQKSKATYFYDVQMYVYNLMLRSFYYKDFTPRIIWAETVEDNPEVRFDQITEHELECGRVTFLEAMDLFHKSNVKFSMNEELRRFEGWETIGLPNWLVNFDNSRF